MPACDKSDRPSGSVRLITNALVPLPRHLLFLMSRGDMPAVGLEFATEGYFFLNLQSFFKKESILVTI